MVDFKSDTIDSVSSYSYIPTGGIVTIGGAFSEYSDASYVSLGLIPCDGRTLNTSTNPEYSSLFSVIGTLYGGTGSTSFQVPNLKNDKIAIVGTSNTFYNINTVGTRVTSIAHSHATTATNNSFSMNAGNTSHSHSHQHNDVGNVSAENQHTHPVGNQGGSLGPNVNKNGPAGTAGGGLNGNHTHNVGSLGANNLADGRGNDHIHSGVLTWSSGANTAVSHTHSASLTNSANTGSSTYSSPSTLGVPYANVLYFIKA